MRIEQNPHKVDYGCKLPNAAFSDSYQAPVHRVDIERARHEITRAVATLAFYSHQNSLEAGWWHDRNTGRPLDRNHGELLALMHSEISEALEGIRKSIMDDKLPNRLMVEVEMADLAIRLFDYVGRFGLDVGGAIVDKSIFNQVRADHKPENRAKDGGKAF